MTPFALRQHIEAMFRCEGGTGNEFGFIRVVRAFLILLALVIAGWTPAFAASPAASIEQTFKDMERRLCASIPSRKCKRAKSPRRKAARTQRREAKREPAKPGATAPEPPPKTQPDVVKPPIPRWKPLTGKLAKPEDAEQPSGETVIAMTPPPLPPEKPTQPVQDESDRPPLPKSKPAARVVVNAPESKEPAPERVVEPEDNLGTCFSKLKALGVDFLPQAAGQGSCSVSQAVLMREIKVGERSVKLPDRPIVNCAYALQFSKWVKATGVPLAKLYTGPGYQCRGRNGGSSGKLSEHGHGNAVDIERVQLTDGRTLWVKDANGDRMLKSMRALGCSHFTTVLGPGSNAAHASHFHFDLAPRRGGYRICE
jgi:hypothetical protein